MASDIPGVAVAAAAARPILGGRKIAWSAVLAGIALAVIADTCLGALGGRRRRY